MREEVLAGFDGGEVDYQPQDGGPFLTRLRAEIEANRGTIAAVGALHGELTAFADAFADLSAIDPVSGASPALVALGTLRNRRAALRALDAGDLPDGRQQGRAGAPARRRRRERAHLTRS